MMRTKRQEVDQKENKATYVRKMHRQLRGITKKVKTLEKIADERHAQMNTRVQSDIDALARKLEEVNAQFEALKEDISEKWPESSRKVSNGYRAIEDLLMQVGSEVKEK